MASTNYIVNIKRWIRYHYWKFLQRFLAVWLALLFLGFVPNFFSPGQALVGDPNPPSYTKPVLQIIQEGLEATVAEAEADPELVPLLDNPFVIVGLVALNVGVAWYFYSQDQQQAAQKLAQQKYCTANPDDSVCVPPFKGGQCPVLYSIYFDSVYSPFLGFIFPNGKLTSNCGAIIHVPEKWEYDPTGRSYGGAYGPILGMGATFSPGILGQHNSQLATIYTGTVQRWLYGPPGVKRDAYGNPSDTFGGIGGGDCWDDCNGLGAPGQQDYVITQVVRADGLPDDCGDPPPPPWKDWPQEKRDAAVKMLNDDDWLSNLQQSPKGGVLPPSAVLPKGHYSFPSDGSAPSHSPGPETVPNNSSPSPSPSPSPTPPPPSPSPSPSSPPPPEPEPEPDPGAGGAMQGGGNLNWNWKSRVTFQHTFDRHGQGSKNTKNLAGRAAGTGEAQGQWLDNQKAAQFLQDLRPNINGPTIVEIPPGLGQVILPDGSIIPATHAQVVPTPIGGYKTAYPVVIAP